MVPTLILEDSDKCCDLFGLPIDSFSSICVTQINKHIVSVLSYAKINLADTSLAISSDPCCIMACIAHAQAAAILMNKAIAKESLQQARQLYNDLMADAERRQCITGRCKGISCQSFNSNYCERYNAEGYNEILLLRIRGFLIGFEMMLEGQFELAFHSFLGCLELEKNLLDLWALKMCELVKFLAGASESLIVIFNSNLNFDPTKLKRVENLCALTFSDDSHSYAMKEQIATSDDNPSSRTYQASPSASVLRNCYVSGIYIYALTQSGRTDDLNQALNLVAEMSFYPSIIDPWSDHAMFHALYNDNDYGHFQILFIASKRSNQIWKQSGTFIQHHLWWHVGLTLIALGQFNAALFLYHKNIWGLDKSDPEEQSGSLQFLVRLAIAVEERIILYKLMTSKLCQVPHDVLLSQNNSRKKDNDSNVDGADILYLPDGLFEKLKKLQNLSACVEGAIHDVIGFIEKESHTVNSVLSGLFDGALIAGLALTGYQNKAEHRITKMCVNCVTELNSNDSEKRAKNNCSAANGYLSLLPSLQAETKRLWEKLCKDCLTWAKYAQMHFKHQIGIPLESSTINYNKEIGPKDHLRIFYDLLSVSESIGIENKKLSRVVASIEQSDLFIKVAWNSIINVLLLLQLPSVASCVTTDVQLRITSIICRLKRIKKRSRGVNNIPQETRRLIITYLVEHLDMFEEERSFWEDLKKNNQFLTNLNDPHILPHLLDQV